MSIEVLCQFTVLLTFVGGIVAYLTRKIVIAPLATAIKALNVTITDLGCVVRNIQATQSDFNERLIRLEEKIKNYLGS